jgi:hypothetical protein
MEIWEFRWKGIQWKIDTEILNAKLISISISLSILICVRRNLWVLFMCVLLLFGVSGFGVIQVVPLFHKKRNIVEWCCEWLWVVMFFELRWISGWIFYFLIFKIYILGKETYVVVRAGDEEVLGQTKFIRCWSWRSVTRAPIHRRNKTNVWNHFTPYPDLI